MLMCLIFCDLVFSSRILTHLFKILHTDTLCIGIKAVTTDSKCTTNTYVYCGAIVCVLAVPLIQSLSFLGRCSTHGRHKMAACMYSVWRDEDRKFYYLTAPE